MTTSTPHGRAGDGRRSAAGASSLTQSLRAVLNSFNDLQRHVAGQLGLGLNDVAALEHLVRRAELGPADLASLLGMSTASATVLVDRLEKAGHVQRQGHPQDRRRKVLLVTDHAQDEVFRALAPLFRLHQDIDEHYSPEERDVIASYLQRVSGAYEAHVRAPAGNEEPETTA